MTNSTVIEQIVLGTILADPKAVPFVGMLATADFDNPHHQMIFQAMHVLAEQGRHPSPIILAPQFHNDLIGETQRPLSGYLRELSAQKRVDRDQIVDYIRALKEFSARRMMAALGQQMIEVAAEPSVSVQDFLDEAAEASSQAASAIRQQALSCFTMAQLGEEVISKLRAKRGQNFVKTGLAVLDEKMGGWPRGELSIIAGRPSMGKSTVAVSALRQAAVSHGQSGILFSLEMRGASLYQRMLSDHVWNSQTPINYDRIMREELADHEIDRLARAAEALGKLDIEIEQRSDLSATEIAIRARRFADKLQRDGKRLDTIMIDHLGFIQPSTRYRGNRVHEIGETTKGLKALAGELDCAMVLVCQLNRESERRDDPRPQMPDLRDSGEIEQDADTVVFCFREFYYLERRGVCEKAEQEQWRQDRMAKCVNKIELILGKRRNGPIFTAIADAFMGSNAIRSLRA
jgi:replicative DNA helicase